MVREPKVVDAAATLEQVRCLLVDDHVHMVLLTDGRYLVGTMTRDDLPGSGARPCIPDHSRRSVALSWSRLTGRTVPATASASATLQAMVDSDRRRLAVIDEDRRLLGLLCLKANHTGFCSDQDVQSRA